MFHDYVPLLFYIRLWKNLTFFTEALTLVHFAIVNSQLLTVIFQSLFQAGVCRSTGRPFAITSCNDSC